MAALFFLKRRQTSFTSLCFLAFVALVFALNAMNLPSQLLAGVPCLDTGVQESVQQVNHEHDKAKQDR